MRLKAAINGQIYDIVEGATFAEEYSETLDSGSIIIDKVQRFDLRPYDDVFIFDADVDEYKGWGLHFDGTVDKDLTEGSEFRYRWTTIVIGQEPGLPPTPLTQFVTAIDIRELGIRPLIQKMQGEWRARISCPYFWTENPGGWPLQSSGRMSALYRITYSPSKLTFDKISDGQGAVSAPQTFEMPYRLTGQSLGYFTMGTYAETGYQAVYFVEPTFTSSIEIGYGEAVSYRGFRKHMLVDQYEATCINITSRTYKYKIDLFSETKKLEKIVLPNIALTQPIELAKRKSVWEYLNRFVEQYSPTVKIGIPSPYETAKGFWVNQRRYSVDPDLESAFSDVYAPEMQMNQPTLRDVLTQLMLTKDRIPYVEDDVIKAMDLSSTAGEFGYSDDETTNIVVSMSSANYATGLKRQFDNALAQTRTCTRVDYLGFRNSDQGLLTLQNLRLEFSYPIYRIDRMLLCYWKRMDLYDAEENPTGQSRYFLCKQDITPLILQNQRRNILSQDWTTFPNAAMNLTVEEMADYRLYTIGYDIGAKEITGWGEIYRFPDQTAKDNGWWSDATKSYIENIIEILDRKHPFGIYEKGWEQVAGSIPDGLHGSPVPLNLVNPTSFPQSPYSQDNAGSSLWIKGLLFQVEYQAFYNGATYADKDDERDDIVSPDNPSSSLTVLEKDGIFQEAKANRFGNEATQINCRYSDPSDMQPLASVFDGDKVVFRREYAIFRNLTITAYSATKGYILKNYFTSVFAQLRPFPLASYEQSVNKAETDRVYVQFSKTRLTIDSPEWTIGGGVILSPFSPSLVPETIGDARNPSKITLQTISKGDDEYASDTQVFANGHSLCVSFQMRDNLGMGNFIREAMPFDSSIYQNALGWDTDDWKTGSEQDWYSVIDDEETGEIDGRIRFMGYNSSDESSIETTSTAVNALYDGYFALPKRPTSASAILGLEKEVAKDGKEVINETLQIEYQADDGIAISEMLPRLNDVLGAYEKWPEDETVTNIENKSGSIRWFGVSHFSLNPRPLETPTDRIAPEFVIGISSTEDLTQLAGKRIYLSTEDKESAARWATKESKATYWSGSLAESGAPSQYASPSLAALEISNIRIISATQSQLTLQWDEKQTFYRHHLLWTGTSETTLTRTATIGRRTIGEPTGWLYFTTGVPTDSNGGGIWGFNTILNDPPTGMSNGYNLPTPPGDGFIYESSSLTETLPQNQFVVYSKNKVKKERVYDEFASIDASGEAFDSVFSVSANQITINLENAPNGTKSVQYWYLDQDSGAYRFVFGADVTDEDLERGFAVVWASVTQTKDRRVFDPNMNQIGECANVTRDIALSGGRFYN